MGDSTNGHGKLDLGADRDSRVHPCAKRTWCVLALEHDGECVEIERAPAPARADWEDKLGLRDPQGWRNKK